MKALSGKQPKQALRYVRVFFIILAETSKIVNWFVLKSDGHIFHHHHHPLMTLSALEEAQRFLKVSLFTLKGIKTRLWKATACTMGTQEIRANLASPVQQRWQEVLHALNLP